MITIQKYVRAQSLEEAYQLNQNKRNRIIGGMLWLKMGSGSIHTAIDLCDLGLNQIEETEDAFIIGAMTSLRQFETHEGLNRYMNGAAANAVKDIVGVQFRNMATIGGSLWGRYGFSDVLSVLLAADCDVELYQGGVIPLEEFASMAHDRDMIVRVIIKKKPASFAYVSMRNQRTDFPVLTCAVSRVNGEIRAAIGARPARAMVIRDREGLLGGEMTQEKAAAFAAYAAANVPTGSNVRASAAYRTHLVRVLTERALLAMGGAK